MKREKRLQRETTTAAAASVAKKEIRRRSCRNGRDVAKRPFRSSTAGRRQRPRHDGDVLLVVPRPEKRRNSSNQRPLRPQQREEASCYSRSRLSCLDRAIGADRRPSFFLMMIHSLPLTLCTPTINREVRERERERWPSGELWQWIDEADSRHGGRTQTHTHTQPR